MALTNEEREELVQLLTNETADNHAGILNIYQQVKTGDLETRMAARVRELIEKL